MSSEFTDVVSRPTTPVSTRTKTKQGHSLGPLSVHCLSSAAGFEQLKDIWQALERRDTLCTPFNTWAWNQLWWRYYGTDLDHLNLLVVRQDNQVVAIAPLYVHATRMCKVIPVGVLRFVGTGGDTSPDYLNIISLPSFRQDAEKAVLDYLPCIKNWHKLLLTDMDETSSLAAQVQARIRSQSGVVLEPRLKVVQKGQLPDSFDTYRAQLSRKRRKQINHRNNRLIAAGEAQLSLCATNADLHAASDALVDLHRQRWASKNAAGGFRSEAYEQFHRAVIQHFFAEDALWLATLKLDGQFIGVQYIFVWRGELLFMQSGYSPAHESLSPGHVLFTYVIERAIEQGMVGLNMLKGHYAYKSTYAKEETHTVDLEYVRPGFRRYVSVIRDSVSR